MSYGTKAANDSIGGRTQSIDTGPRERAQHGGGLTVAPRSVAAGGIVSTEVGAQAAFECVLDVLLGNDQLLGTQGSRQDRQAVARSRYEAGMKFRRLFVDAGLVGVKAFDMNGARGGSQEISDKEAAARAKFNELMRRLGRQAVMAQGPCCFDTFLPGNQRWLEDVRVALDHLCEAVL